MNLKELLEKSPTFILFKEGCPYCIRAHDALPDAPMYNYLEYTEVGNEITNKYGHATYPKIFLEGEFVGGYSDLAAKKNL